MYMAGSSMKIISYFFLALLVHWDWRESLCNCLESQIKQQQE